MKALPKNPPRNKPTGRPRGRPKRDLAAKIAIFVEEYLVNGHNATNAARAAGYIGSPGTLAVRGVELMAQPGVREEIATRSQQAVKRVIGAAEANTDNWLREVAALSYSRVGELYDDHGEPIPVHLLPDHVQAAIASVETKGGKQFARFADKTTALGMMAKHLGLFERDNIQRREDVRVMIQLVG